MASSNNFKQIITLTIQDVVYPGLGIGRTEEGCVVFIPDVVTGDTVSAQVKRKHKNYIEAELIEVTRASRARIKPMCPLYESCPGCCYQHITYEDEIGFKQNQLHQLLSRLGKVETLQYLTPVPSPQSLGYRNKITLHMYKDKDRFTLGYISYDNRTIFEVFRCPLALEDINDYLVDLRGNTTFIQSLRNGSKVTFRHTENDGTLVYTKRSRFLKKGLVESTVLGKISVPVKSFFQINRPIADRLILRVMDLLRQDIPDQVIDLYCGVGVFSLAAQFLGVGSIYAIDADARAVETAKENAEGYGFTNGIYLAGDASFCLKDVLTRMTLSNYHLILDPPRRGISKRIVQSLAIKPPSQIIYISCAPDTLARDIARLAELGFRVDNTQLFDMFPRTPFFESLTVLQG